MKKLLCVFFVFFASCEKYPLSPFLSLASLQPYVKMVVPEGSSPIEQDMKIELQFSTKLSEASIGKDSIFLIHGTFENKNPQDFLEAVEEGSFSTTNLDFIYKPETLTVEIYIKDDLSEGFHTLVVTPNLTSEGGLPFNQSPTNSPELFLSVYAHGQSYTEILESLPPTGPLGPTDNKPLYGPSPTALIINEILYDVPGSDGDGQLFIELYGSPNTDISLYQLLFINGENGEKTDQIELPLGTYLEGDGLFVIADFKNDSETETFVEHWDFLDDFDPQNGPDSIQLLDRDDNLLDVIGYGEIPAKTAFNGFPLRENAPAIDVASGHSLSRINGIDTNNNAIDFVDLATPTPGQL